MPHSPLFSVIIPAYKCAQFIQQTLRSVYQQTESDYEIIVINDGSPDNLAEVLEKETDPRLRVITQDNGGVSRARNRGIEEARGTYLAFLDSDDAWLPFHLEKARLFFEQFPQYHWYATKLTPTEVINDTDFTVPTPDCSYFATNWFMEMAPAPISQTAVIKREWAQKHLHFPEDIKMYEDNVAWSLFAIDAGAIGTIDKPTCLYRQWSGSATKSFWNDWKQNEAWLGLDALLIQQELLKHPNCPIETRLYFRIRSLHNWIARLQDLKKADWRSEILQCRRITGNAITLFLYIFSWCNLITYKIIYRLTTRALSRTRNKLDCMLERTKITLS